MGADRWYVFFVSKRRRIIAVLIAVIFVGVVVAVVWPREREPVYQGKKLSEWIVDYTRGQAIPELATEAEMQAAVAAVKKIGTNGLPWMIRSLSVQSPAWRRKILWRFGIGENPAITVLRGPAAHLALLDEDFRAGQAQAGFKLMGEDAALAVPRLTWLMNSSPSGQISDRAIRALLDIGSNGVASVVATITNEVTSLQVRCDAALCLSTWSKAGMVGIEILVVCLDDWKTPGDLRHAALISLGSLGTLSRPSTPDVPPRRLQKARRGLQNLEPPKRKLSASHRHDLSGDREKRGARGVPGGREFVVR